MGLLQELRPLTLEDIDSFFANPKNWAEETFRFWDATNYMEGQERFSEIEDMVVLPSTKAGFTSRLEMFTLVSNSYTLGYPEVSGVLRYNTVGTVHHIEGELHEIHESKMQDFIAFLYTKLGQGYTIFEVNEVTVRSQALTGHFFLIAQTSTPAKKDGWVSVGPTFYHDFETEQLAIYDEIDGIDVEESTDYYWDNTDNTSWVGNTTNNSTATNYGYTYKSTYTYTPVVSKKFESATEDSELVWYAAYGSNLNEERFLRYANKERFKKEEQFQVGDFTSVRASSPFRMFFAHHSSTWGGGIAFLDDQVQTPEFSSELRLWLLTRQQFWSLVCQENGSTNITLDWEKVGVEREFLPVQKSLYSRVVTLGYVDGLPVVTCTNREGFAQKLGKESLPWQYEQMGAIKPPSVSYLNTINAGLEEMEELERVEIDFLPLPTPEDIGALF